MRELVNAESEYFRLGTRNELGILLCTIHQVYFRCHFQVLETSGLIVLGDFNIHFGAGLSGVVQEYRVPCHNRAVDQYNAASMVNLMFCSNQEAVLTVELWSYE